ncbi:MAG: DUF1566 domain-containing protein [Bryobacteraceae bacterium]|nr:DUF1566 domain-containing protein [Bryobacteraceae bacterium]
MKKTLGLLAALVAMAICVSSGRAAPKPKQQHVVLKTGQTTVYVTGDDGYHQAGAQAPSPRFTDNKNGTVTDKLTKLTWLKNAECLGQKDWSTAISAANALASGACGLTDRSLPGDWRLPNRNELMSLIDVQAHYPALPAGHPFKFVPADYWSSTTNLVGPAFAWVVSFVDGSTGNALKSGGNSFFVTAVRGGM